MFQRCREKTPLKSSDAALDAAIPSCSCTAILEILEKKGWNQNAQERDKERKRD
jgi:uncharacterized OsmC-like protein